MEDIKIFVRKIKRLRQLTGLGLFFAKQLLEECNNDVDKAFGLAKQRQLVCEEEVRRLNPQGRQ